MASEEELSQQLPYHTKQKEHTGNRISGRLHETALRRACEHRHGPQAERYGMVVKCAFCGGMIADTHTR